jgi:hypothetical protein
MRGTMRYKVLLVFAVLWLFGSMQKAHAQDVDYKAYSLFVYNFMKYIEWPESTGKSEFVVGIIGDSPIYQELQTLSKTKKAKGKNIVVKKITTIDEAIECQMVYVAQSKSSMLKPLNEKIKGKPVLVVGEREGLAEKGAALSFVTLEDDVLKFDINRQTIEQHSLKIPGSLVALGIVVR